MTDVEHRCTVKPIHHTGTTRPLLAGGGGHTATFAQWLVHCPACGDSTVRGGTRDGVDLFTAQHYAEHHGAPLASDQPEHGLARTLRYARGWQLGVWCACGRGWRGPDADAHAALAAHLEQYAPPDVAPVTAATAAPVPLSHLQAQDRSN